MPTAFPDVIACFTLVLILPVASATAERSFSVMRHANSHLRASMADSILSAIDDHRQTAKPTGFAVCR